MIFLTGIKPTGQIHLGNYAGAIQPVLESIEEGHTGYFFLADYHSLTVHPTSSELNQNSREILAALLTFLDKHLENVSIYRQSRIPEIFELYYIMNCYCGKGFLNRAHAYKTLVDLNIQRKKEPDHQIDVGLYTYPTLMASDILLFQPDFIPVGQDQKQHIEIMQELAKRLNVKYGENFLKMPIAKFQHETALPGLDGRKMSKSYGNTIPLFCEENKLKKLIFSIATNSKNVGEPKFADESNVVLIYKFFAKQSDYNQLIKEMESGISWGVIKEKVFELLREMFTSKREKYLNYLNNDYIMTNILMRYENDLIENKTKPYMKKIKEKIGFF